MARAITGRKAAVYLATGNPISSGPTAMTWDVTNKRASVSDDLFLQSDNYPFCVLLDGVLTIGSTDIAASTTPGDVDVAAFTANLAGAEISVSAGSVSGLTKSAVVGDTIVYAITYTGSALAAVAGTTGVLNSVRGAAGGPPYIPVGSICLGYVSRPEDGSTTVVASEISITSFDGREWAYNPAPFENRPLLGRADFDSLPAAVHTGDAYPVAYLTGYNFADNFVKVGQIMDWNLSSTIAREDATTQNSGAAESDRGRKTYAFSGNKFISEIADEIFSHQNDGEIDVIIKMTPDRTQPTKYLAAQMSIDSAMDFPNAEKQKSSITGNITGYVEEFGS